MDDEVHQGPLILPGKNLIKSKRQKFGRLHRASAAGIARLEIFDSAEPGRPPARIVTLEDCIKVARSGPAAFALTTRTASYEFGAAGAPEAEQWAQALQAVAFENCERDNELYCSVDESSFNVRVHPSPASDRCALDARLVYVLVLAAAAMRLKTVAGAVLFTWPYCFIRRYGFKQGKFTFEAGRKCDSGEGVFLLDETKPGGIFKCLALRMKSMKQSLTESTMVLECGSQLQAAMSMEARSRSPLPPSVAAATCLEDFEVNPISEKKITVKPLDLIEKKIPSKPPRKSPPIAPKPQLEYTPVEFRRDAWKTLGIETVAHSETVLPCTDDEYGTWGMMRAPLPSVAPIQSPPAVPNEEEEREDAENYDKLDYFGSSSKLNLQASSYKQMAMGGTQSSSQSSINDYDEVGPSLVILEGEKRMADDSYLGYAQVQKMKPKDGVCHQICNDAPYAVISKPKRV